MRLKFLTSIVAAAWCYQPGEVHEIGGVALSRGRLRDPRGRRARPRAGRRRAGRARAQAAMTVPAQANALMTVDELRGENSPLNITGNEQDDMVQTITNRASDWIEAYCNRPFVERLFVSLRFPPQRSPELRPRATPINVAAPVVVTLGGATLSVWRSEDDGDPTAADVIVGGDTPGEPSYLYRGAGWDGAAPAPIALTYTGGYPFASIPGEIKEAAMLIVQAFHRHWKNLDPVQSMPAGATGGVISFRTDHVPMAARVAVDRFRVLRV
jgi:hypothetical protein